jgi:hypothetical protein
LIKQKTNKIIVTGKQMKIKGYETLSSNKAAPTSFVNMPAKLPHAPKRPIIVPAFAEDLAKAL